VYRIGVGFHHAVQLRRLIWRSREALHWDKEGLAEYAIKSPVVGDVCLYIFQGRA
jgi:hypothetical protein